MRESVQWLHAVACVVGLVACGYPPLPTLGGDDGGGDASPCDPIAQSGCGNREVCEQVTGSITPACFAPAELRGRVLDLATKTGVAGARVIAVDINGAAASGVAISAADGTYALQVPAQRGADGTPGAFPLTLRADAAGYQSFPGTLRQPLPVDLATAVSLNGTYVVQSPLTDVGLFARAAAGTGAIHGHAEVVGDHPAVLVVGESGGRGSAVLAARDGDYTIFNLEAGHYVVTAYAVGHVFTAAETDVATSSVALNLALSGDAPGSVTGTVSIVNGNGFSNTSVVAFVESTFDVTTGRGIAPPGLRAPRTGAPNITGAFTLDGVPPGRYVVVAAFENDGLVRDPDHCIAGTTDVHVVVAAGLPTAAPTTFKITGSLAVISPGADMAEPVTAAPTFSWTDDSGEDLYLVEVFNAFGQLVWMQTTPGVSGVMPSLAYGGPMVPGMYYQWRVTSSRKGTTVQCELARSEDLRGVFYVP